MKRIIVTFLILIFFNSASFSKEQNFNVKSGDFNEFGRYVQTLEFNEPEIVPFTQKNEEDEILFELEAVRAVKERYEANSVELKLNEPANDAIYDVNSERLFKIKVNENQYKIENAIKNENMIWDDSNLFKLSVLHGRRYFAPVPSVVNSSKIGTDLASGLSAYAGQVSLHDAAGTSVLFMRANESTYNTGTVMSYRGKKINAATGSFSSSYNHASSGGLILSADAFSSPLGSFSFGGAFGAKEDTGYDKLTSGLFGEYTYKRLKINAQISSTGYSDKQNHETGLYLIPEFKLTDSLSLKTRFIRNVTQNTLQDELVLSYSPRKSNNNLSLELNASSYGGEQETQRRRIKFTASFKI